MMSDREDGYFLSSFFRRRAGLRRHRLSCRHHHHACRDACHLSCRLLSFRHLFRCHRPLQIHTFTPILPYTVRANTLA